MTDDRLSCSCGNSELVLFSPEYLRCPRCDTLVGSRTPEPDGARVVDDGAAFVHRQLETAEGTQVRDIEQHRRRLLEIEAQRNDLMATVEAQQHEIQVGMTQLRDLEGLIKRTRAYKVLRLLGRWKWLDQGFALPPDHSAGRVSMAKTAEGLGADDRLAERLSAVRVPGAPRTPTLQQADVVITGNEVTDKHGTGALVRRIFGQAHNVFSIRSFNHYGGDHDFGDASACLNQADASRSDVFQNVLTALRGSTIKRTFCVPFFREDFLTAIAVRDVYGAPLVAWIMDDHNVSANGVADALVWEFLTKCSLRFVTHPELRDAYERKFALRCWLLPAVVPDRLIAAEAPASPDEAPASGTGALLGSVWSERWFEMLWQTLQGAGITLDWYGNAEYHWLRDSPEDLRRKHLVLHGVVPEERLVQRLRTHSYVVVPTGTRDQRDDQPALSELSLPGRILFALATAHTPVIVLGSRRTSAARFVERFEIGRVSDYDAGAFRETVAYINRNEVQCRMRHNAARVARRFSDAGIAEWIWTSLDRGEPCDHRFEELMPRSSDDAAPRIESPAAGEVRRD